VRVALDALEAAFAAGEARDPAPRSMWARLEHLQLVDAHDLARFGPLRVAASVQPGHLLSDAAAAQQAWADRLAAAYRWRTLLARGVPLAFGTDAPVEAPDPWPGIALAVTRHVPGASEAFPGEEALDLAQALRAATLGPAMVAGEDERSGRLTTGYRADLIVIPAAALDELPRVEGALGRCRPLLTLIDGEEAWRAPALA
jgi:predicted amidohydrolase YtcJ